MCRRFRRLAPAVCQVGHRESEFLTLKTFSVGRFSEREFASGFLMRMVVLITGRRHLDENPPNRGGSGNPLQQRYLRDLWTQSPVLNTAHKVS